MDLRLCNRWAFRALNLDPGSDEWICCQNIIHSFIPFNLTFIAENTRVEIIWDSESKGALATPRNCKVSTACCLYTCDSFCVSWLYFIHALHSPVRVFGKGARWIFRMHHWPGKVDLAGIKIPSWDCRKVESKKCKESKHIKKGSQVVAFGGWISIHWFKILTGLFNYILAWENGLDDWICCQEIIRSISRSLFIRMPSPP
jgi:hypothetical protein